MTSVTSKQDYIPSPFSSTHHFTNYQLLDVLNNEALKISQTSAKPQFSHLKY